MAVAPVVAAVTVIVVVVETAVGSGCGSLQSKTAHKHAVSLNLFLAER